MLSFLASKIRRHFGVRSLDCILYSNFVHSHLGQCWGGRTLSSTAGVLELSTASARSICFS